MKKEELIKLANKLIKFANEAPDNVEIKYDYEDDAYLFSEYDSNGNEIHRKTSYGFEVWNEYYNNGNINRYRYPNGEEHEFDSNGHEIYRKDSNGYEEWLGWDNNGNINYYKDSNGKEYWKEYDNYHNVIHYKNINGEEKWY